jgi:hypothetical protein
MFSAVPRMARPAPVPFSRYTRPAMTTGTASMIMKWPPENRMGSTSWVKWNGTFIEPPRMLRVSSNSPGRAISIPANTWARPTVASVRISRGTVKKRRMTRTSTAAPSRAAKARPAPTAAQYDQCRMVANSSVRVAAAEPMATWAKLMTRAAR